MKRMLCLLMVLAFSALGCNAVPASTDDTNGNMPNEPSSITDTMREACPLLTDEVLEGFVFAIASLRDEGLGEEDALALWVESCESIPPDGNFQGDIEACRACLPVIVAEVYSSGA